MCYCISVLLSRTFQISAENPTVQGQYVTLFIDYRKRIFAQGLALCPFPIGWNADTLGALAAFFILSIFCIGNLHPFVWLLAFLLPLKRQGWQASECVQDLNVTEYIFNDHVSNAAGFYLHCWYLT